MSTQEVLFPRSPLLLRLLIVARFFPGYYATILTCPEYFSEEAVEKVNCSVNTTNYAYSCLDYSTTVDFFLEKALHTRILLCSAPYNGKCDEEPVGEMNCSCVESHDGVNTYQLNFLGNKTVYEGESLSCEVECLSVNIEFIVFCRSLKYKATEMIPPSTPLQTEDTSSTSDTTATTVETETTEITPPSTPLQTEVFYKTTEQESKVWATNLRWGDTERFT